MKQMIIRTSKNARYIKSSAVNKYLSNGWIVLMANPIGDYIEYVLQKNE
jgi:hypothetical protein